MPAIPRLRVLVVNPSGVVGGAESWLLSVLGATERIECDVLLLADGPLRAQMEDAGYRVRSWQVGPKPEQSLAAAGRLYRELRRTDYDVVLANGIKAQVVAGPASRLAGVPVVWVKHDFSYDGSLARPLALLADRVIATAEEVGAATSRDDVVVVEPPRPGEPLPRDVARERLAELGVRPEPGRHLLVMPARMVPYKGIDTAIRALAEPGATEWDLLAVGPDEPRRPDERERLRAVAQESGVAGRVHLLPYVEGLPLLLGAADAVAVLTRPDGARTPGREGFGMVAMEAGLAGVPVIAIDDGGPIASRIGSSAGILVPADDPAAVGRALATLTDEQQRSALGDAGRATAEHHPDDAECARAVVEVLARAAHRPGAGLRASSPITVVSPVLDEIDSIGRLVDTVCAQMLPGDEYVLVDGESSDGTAQWLRSRARSDERVRVVEVPRGTTIGAARNAGIRAARNGHIALTDAGCLPTPGWLGACRAALAEPGAELVIGVYSVNVRPGSLFEAAMAAAAWPDPVELRRATPLRLTYARLFGRAFSASRLDGRSVAMRRTVWEEAGGFPEQLRTAEDEAFGRAALAAGAHSELSADAEVTWFQRGTVRSTFRQFRGYGEGGGRSGSPLLLGRDAARVGAYVAAAVALARGGTGTRAAVAAGAAAYLSLPVARVVRRRQSPAAIPLIPAVMVMKDTAKLLGTARTLALGSAGVSKART